MALALLTSHVAYAKTVSYTSSNIPQFIAGGTPDYYYYNFLLSSLSYTVTYGATITNNSTGASITDGASVPTGTSIRLAFANHATTDISWFGTGGSTDSPNGYWGPGAPTTTTCNAADYLGTYSGTDQNNNSISYKVYVPFYVSPPTETITPGANLTCNAPVTDANGNTYEDCTVTSAGTISPTFSTADTQGRWYHRFLKGGSCFITSYSPQTDTPFQPSSCGFLAAPACNSTWTLNGNGVDIPPQTITFSFTATQAAAPPNAPTITGGPGTTCSATSFSFQTTDPNGDQLRYGVDWNNDGTVDSYLPSATTLVNSGTSQSATHLWSTPGTYTFKALGQDSHGSNSGWTSKSVTITACVVAPTVTLTASPSSILSGSSATLTWTTTNSPTSCTWTAGLSGSASTAGGSTSVSPSANTTYTISCSNSAGTDTDTTTVTVTQPAKPDLTAGSVTPTSAIANTATTFSSTITNSGTASTGASFANKLQKANDSSGTGATDVVTGVSMATLGSGLSNTANFSYTFPVSDGGTTKYLRACADSGSVITESNEANNCGAWTAVAVAAPSQPDLTAGAITPTAATTGSAVTLASTIQNTGTTATGAGFTDTFQSATDSSGTGATSIGTWTSPALGASSSNSANLSYTFSSIGTYYIRACADTGSVITESNEANNCGAWTPVTVTGPVLPDLTTSAILSPSSTNPGTGVSAAATITNGGTGSTGSSFSNLLQEADDAVGTNASDLNVGITSTLAAGTGRTVSIAFAGFPNSDAGKTKYLRICADKSSGSDTGTISESNETNNCGAWTPITIASISQPDLTASSITPTTATQNTPVNLVTTITNIGTAGTSGSFTDKFQKATDSSGTGAVDIGTDGNSTALAANGGSTGSTLQNYTFTTAGTWYVRACADSTNVVAESNEGNNCGAWTAVVVSAPAAPAISSCTPSPAVAAPNQSVTWTVSTTGFSPSANSYTWSVTGGTPSSQSGSSATFASSFTSGGSYAPTVRASNGSQSVGPTSCTPATISGAPYSCSGIPTATISASPTRVVSGNSSTITWSATGIATGQSCTITGPNVGGSGVNSVTTSVSDSSCNVSGGTATINNITAQSEYTITCTGATAQTAIVNVTPKVQEF